MFTSLFDWLDHRTGIKQIWAMMMLEGIPGGARWRYVWGSALAFVFSIQLVTGILLMTAYSPSASQAWSSVHFIQYQMDFGWLIRGLHHFGSQTMMVLIGLHMLQVVIAGAHLPPREVNWWLGIALFGVTFGLSLTGYLLPWDQKGYWATRVATNISGTMPGLGEFVKQLLVGGEDYGNHTLTRFYALHVGVLPLSLIFLLVLHLIVFRRHGVTSKVNVEGLVTNPKNEHAPGTEMFWPRQAFYDLIACLVIFGIMLGLVFYGDGHPVKEAPTDKASYEYWAKAGQRGLGANLDAAADRQTSNYPARPEWYFLFLFQLLKYFEGEHVLIGTAIIPNGVMLLLVLLPLFGVGPFRTIGHWLGIFVMLTLFAGVGLLTLLAFRDDRPEGLLWLKHPDEASLDKAKSFQKSRHEAEEAAKRACQLAMAGTPVEGGHVLLRQDPLMRGHKLFQTNCGACHNFSARGEGPHGGPITEATGNPYRFEVKIESIPDVKNKSMVVYILDSKGRTTPKLDAASVKDVKVSIKHPKLDLDFKHDPNRAGLAFVAENDQLDDYTPYAGIVQAVVDGKTYHGEFPTKVRDPFPSVLGSAKAGDLGEWGSKEWIREFLDEPTNDRFYGHVKVDGKHVLTGMRGWRRGIEGTREGWDKDKIATQDTEFDKIAEWLALHGRPKEIDDPNMPLDEKKKKTQEAVSAALEGQAAFFKKSNKCANCHTAEKLEVNDGKLTFTKDGGDSGPELVGYGSADWLRAMIMRPGHKTRFDEKNQMPAFRPLTGPGSELALQEFRESNPGTKDSQILNLSDLDRELIIRFMMRDYRPIYGGAPIK